MPNFSNIGLQEPSTITNRVAAVTIDRGGTAEQQEILVLGDGESSGAVARVLNAAPDSTTYGLVVRPLGQSTTVQVSSVAGVVVISPVSTASLRVEQSTAADLQATVTQASTVWAVQLSQYSTTANVSSVSGVVSISPVSTAAVIVRPATAMTYGQVELSTTPAEIAAANTARQRLLIVQHSSAVNAFLGASTVSAATGLLLMGVPGNQVVFRHDDAVYGVTASSTGRVSFVQETL
jgi:hypothetical protein